MAVGGVNPPGPPCGQEEEEDHFLFDDMTYHVLEMLNFKVVPKEVGDPGYRDDNQWYPEESVYYAREWTRMNDEIDKLKAEKEDLLRRVQGAERQVEEERSKVEEAQKQVGTGGGDKEKLKTVRSEKKKLNKELKSVKKQLEDKESEFVATSLKVEELTVVCNTQKEELEKKDRLIQDHRKECQEAMEVTKEREQEIEDYKSAVDKIRKELETAKSEVEVGKKKVTELEERLAKRQLENLKVSGKLTSQAEVVKKLEKELEVRKEEIINLKKEAEELQKILASVESEWEKSRDNAASAEADFTRIIEKLEEKLKESNNSQLVQKDGLDKINKERDDLQGKCKKLRQFVDGLVEEFGKIIEYLKSESSAATLVSHEDVNTSARQKLAQLSVYTDMTFQSWFNQIKQVKEELEETSKAVAAIGPIIVSGELLRNRPVAPQQRQQQQRQGPVTSTPVGVGPAPGYRQSLNASPILHPPNRQRFPVINSFATATRKTSYRDMVMKNPPKVTSMTENTTCIGFRGVVDEKPNKSEVTPTKTPKAGVEPESSSGSDIFENSNENTVCEVTSQDGILDSQQITGGNSGKVRQQNSGGSEIYTVPDSDSDSNPSTETVSTSSVTGGVGLGAAQNFTQETTENTSQLIESPSNSSTASDPVIPQLRSNLRNRRNRCNRVITSDSSSSSDDDSTNERWENKEQCKRTDDKPAGSFQKTLLNEACSSSSPQNASSRQHQSAKQDTRCKSTAATSASLQSIQSATTEGLSKISAPQPSSRTRASARHPVNPRCYPPSKRKRSIDNKSDTSSASSQSDDTMQSEDRNIDLNNIFG